ncbi:MAG: hypothetical protein WBV65_20490 [Xanthobacteraceae bacterium]
MGHPAKPEPQPTIIVHGLNASGRPRAGRFKGSDVGAALKAAAELGLAVTEIATPTGRALTAKIPMGRIGATADRIVSSVSKELYEQIRALEQQKNGNHESLAATEGASSAVQPRLPKNWEDVKAGDRVIARETDPADGWWEVTVTEVKGALVRLRWPGSRRDRPIQKHRTMLGLICPTENKDQANPDSKQPTDQSSAVYPADWSAITVDQTVLAKEDGPVEQWWEAKVLKADRDEFTLQWRDYPNLPQIVRGRSALGLMHPAPKIR